MDKKNTKGNSSKLPSGLSEDSNSSKTILYQISPNIVICDTSMSTSFFMQHRAAVKTNCVFEWSLLQMKIASHLTEKPLTVDTVTATRFPPEASLRARA